MLRYYADNAAAFLADEPVDAASVNASKAYAHYLPIGVVLAIMPWNFPLWQAMRFAAPALAAGQRRSAQAREQRARRPRSSWRSCSATPASPTTSSRRC